MHAFLEQISPDRRDMPTVYGTRGSLNPATTIRGLVIFEALVTEGQQIVRAVRGNNAPVWWLMAKDEGHGFAKKANPDYQFLAMTEFLQQYLLQ